MKKAIVIGGSSGIGKAIVEILLSNNYLVGLSGLERDDLTVLQKANADNLVIKYIDCSKDNCSVEINELAEMLGGLDLLVFTAGIGHLNKDLGFQAENHANKVNILGFIEVADWSYRFFDRQGAGYFVAISSMAGLFGFRRAPGYTAAKSYQINYLEALRQKAHKSKPPICVTDIRSGFVDTAMSKHLNRFWVATPEKAARQIYGAIKKRNGVRYVTKRWQIISLIIKLMPGWVRGRL